MSLVRLMAYSNDINIEGIVATVSHNLDSVYTQPIDDAIAAYSSVRSNLVVHDPNYPSAATLSGYVAEGPASYGVTYALTESPISDGAQIIIDAIDKDNVNPIYIPVWGDGAVIAQALNWIKTNRSAAAASIAASKLRVIDMAGQDDSGAWLKDADNYPDLWYYRMPTGYLGMDPQSDILAAFSPPCPTCFDGDTAWSSDYWAATNIQNHGALGAEYPDRKYLKEGDSPTLLYLLGGGLSNPEYPWYGSWGGRSTQSTVAGVRSNRDPLGPPDETAESDYDPYYMYDMGEDTWSGNTDDWASLYRWIGDFNRDFSARMDWSIQSSYSNANHAPSVMLQGVSGDGIYIITADASDNLILSAAGTTDPDGDNLTYDWFYYKEAGTYSGAVTINNSTTSTATVVIPAGASGTEIHVILRVYDDGTPSLAGYRRAIITVN